jgi:hypothetical protein
VPPVKVEAVRTLESQRSDVHFDLKAAILQSSGAFIRRYLPGERYPKGTTLHSLRHLAS